MNFTETFEQFSSKVSTMDLALYAGIGLALWIIFKDRLSPVQKIVLDLAAKAKDFLATKAIKSKPVDSISVLVPASPLTLKENKLDSEDIFFKLVVSWKQTRDLAVKSNCVEAVRVADEMFPFLSPTVCQSKKESVDE
jgi:hypothetical protein